MTTMVNFMLCVFCHSKIKMPITTPSPSKNKNKSPKSQIPEVQDIAGCKENRVGSSRAALKFKFGSHGCSVHSFCSSHPNLHRSSVPGARPTGGEGPARRSDLPFLITSAHLKIGNNNTQAGGNLLQRLWFICAGHNCQLHPLDTDPGRNMAFPDLSHLYKTGDLNIFLFCFQVPWTKDRLRMKTRTVPRNPLENCHRRTTG
jgi:hypothetical protein